MIKDMKKDVRREESFIFAIYNKRHRVNEIVLILPFALALLFSLIGAPIIMVYRNLSVPLSMLLFVGPIIIVLFFYLVRKKIIINNFVKIKDTSDRIELTEIRSDVFEAAVIGKVFMFPYSEYMETILYNWFSSMNVLGAGKLKMHKVFYDNYAPVYLAVCEADLNIPEEYKDNYEKETGTCLILSDMLHGKTVNEKIYSRLSHNTERKQ